jgi:hypothetical protein
MSALGRCGIKVFYMAMQNPSGWVGNCLEETGFQMDNGGYKRCNL